MFSGDSGGAIVCMEEIEYEGKAKNIPVQYGLVSSGRVATFICLELV